MMKKNGFIAMSLIYSFFVVFLLVIFTILAFYTDTNYIIKNLNSPVMTDYNKIKYCTNCSPKLQYYTNVYDNYTEYSIPIGSYVYVPFSNYDGLFMVYDDDFVAKYQTYSVSVYKLVSENPVGIDSMTDLSSFDYNNIPYIDSINLSYNSSLASDPMTTIDPRKYDYQLFSNYGIASIDTAKLISSSIKPDIYKTMNVGYYYHVNFRYSDNVYYDGLFIPNCSCGSNSYLNYLYNTSTKAFNSLTSPTLEKWASSYCSGYNVIVSSCPLYFIRDSVPASFSAPNRMYIVLKKNTVVTGGSGTKSDPYLLGVTS